MLFFISPYIQLFSLQLVLKILSALFLQENLPSGHVNYTITEA